MPLTTRTTVSSCSRHIVLADPWNANHSIDCCVRSARLSDDPAISPCLDGRAALTLSLGEFTVTLRPSAAELRALASAMLHVADELDGTAT